MMKRSKPYEEIYDLLAIRVLVKTVSDCYHALGVIHDGWTPLQERIKDYIAQPKSNGYQSLHTTVFGPGRQLFEIQIRTRDMHRTAEFGIAAHWLYKDGTKSADELERHLSWFRQVLELQLDARTPDEFLEFLKLDLYQDEIFVFTPNGDVIRLPKGATRSTSRSPSTRRSGSTARARRSLARLLRFHGRSRTPRRSRSSRLPRRVPVGTGWPTSERTRAPQDPAVAETRRARDVDQARSRHPRPRDQASPIAEAGG